MSPVEIILVTLGWVLLWIVLGLLALLLLLVLLLLLMPISARAEGSIDNESMRGDAAMRWAWGFLGVRIEPGAGATLRLLGVRIARLGGGDDASKEKSEKKKKKKPRRRTSIRELLGHRRTYWRLLLRFGRALHLRLRVVGMVGTGDPADTVLLMQWIDALGRRVGPEHLQVVPDYLDERLELDGRGSIWIWPMQLAWILLSIFLRKETRLALRAMRGRAPQREYGR